MTPTNQNYLLDFIVLYFKETIYHGREIISVLFFFFCSVFYDRAISLGLQSDLESL